MQRGKSKGWLYGFGGVLMLSTGLLLLFLRSRSLNPEEAIELEMQNAMNPYNVKLWKAVSKHETGNFTSPIFRENKNLFGMKLPRVRPTKATGENRGHATFNSLQDSVADQILFLNYNGYRQVNTPEELVTWMKNKGYFTDSYANYLNGVKRFL
jgi:hypothetical protein